jgi:hypothetical protein
MTTDPKISDHSDIEARLFCRHISMYKCYCFVFSCVDTVLGKTHPQSKSPITCKEVSESNDVRGPKSWEVKMKY